MMTVSNDDNIVDQHSNSTNNLLLILLATAQQEVDELPGGLAATDTSLASGQENDKPCITYMMIILVIGQPRTIFQPILF
jgi:hypothetical protein